MTEDTIADLAAENERLKAARDGWMETLEQMEARIAELEAACQRLRDDHQGALAERDEARAEVERKEMLLNTMDHFAEVAETCERKANESHARRKAAEADAAGLRARMQGLADEWAECRAGYGVPDPSWSYVEGRLRALAAEPTPAAEPHAEDVDETYWAAHTSDGRCKYPTLCREDPALTDHRPAPVADPDDTKDGQR